MEYNKGICFLISNKVMNKKIFSRILFVVILLLCIPFFAMQLNSSVHWSLGDFILMGLLLMGLGISITLILNRIKNRKKSLVYIWILIILFLLIWTELAVGIFNTPFAGS
ncbi:MAG: hypothetical protein RLZZ605_582 [Bacteroidota bacterium]